MNSIQRASPQLSPQAGGTQPKAHTKSFKLSNRKSVARDLQPAAVAVDQSTASFQSRGQEPQEQKCCLLF